MDLRDLPLERTANLPGVLVRTAEDGAIGADTFAGLTVAGAAVLVSTGWSKRWTDASDYFRSGPYLTRDACEFLVAERAALVGIDCANIDNMQDASRPAHTVLLRAGIPIVEHLTNLAALAEKQFRFFAAPPAIAGGTSFVVRAFALCE
jgi:kynurenine formamidase